MKALGAEDGLVWVCGWEERTCELLFLISCMYLPIYARMTYTFARIGCFVEAFLVVKFSRRG